MASLTPPPSTTGLRQCERLLSSLPDCAAMMDYDDVDELLLGAARGRQRAGRRADEKRRLEAVQQVGGWVDGCSIGAKAS